MTPTLPNLPDHIETDRLLIRPHHPGDGRALFEATVESLTDLRRWPAAMGWALEEPSEEQSEAFCRQCAQDFAARREFPLLLTDKASGEIVGSSGLHRPDWSVPKLEIGWWVRTGRGGRGLVTEGARAIVEFGFAHLGARRIFALPDDENAASCRVCERIGMQFEGLLRNERAEPGGRLRNTRMYAAIR
ncbi:MAG TPA: GNAT family N-acetyltransferase [Caulobacteraceae bacterium]